MEMNPTSLPDLFKQPRALKSNQKISNIAPNFPFKFFNIPLQFINIPLLNPFKDSQHVLFWAL